mmetsp:Transcript_39887/g.71672  ORF Transcript_39887/g.71672 Transcript_39887/m.71672 type:complete len:831 (+) Transcript_39887:23-2515(+)
MTSLGAGYVAPLTSSSFAGAAKKVDPIPKKELELEDALKLQRLLIEGFSDKEFQQKLKLIDERLKHKKGQLAVERSNLFLTVQNKVLPNFGFLDGQKGVVQMVEALQSKKLLTSTEFIENNFTCNKLLGIPTPGVPGENKESESSQSTVTVKHAIKQSETVKVTVTPTTTLAQIKEAVSHKLGRPDIMKKGRIVKKDEETGYFAGEKETAKIGQRKTILLIGVEDLKATRQVPNISKEQALEIVESIRNAYAGEAVQRGLLQSQWIVAEASDADKWNKDAVDRMFKIVLPSFGFDGSREGWRDFQNMVGQYCADEKFFEAYNGTLSFLEGDTANVEQLFQKSGGTLLQRPAGGIYLRQNLGPNVPSLATGEVFAVRTAHRTQERWAALPSLVLNDRRPSSIPTVIVDPSVRYQTVLGFGGSFTESSASLFTGMSAANQARLVDSCFDTAVGLGYYVARMHINSCDFSDGDWSCCDKEGDTNLYSFSVERYKRAIFPLMHKCQDAAGGSLMLVASPWSPPKWMKDNASMLSGGKLKYNMRDCWSRFYIRFAKEMQAEGLPLWALTVQNEPLAHTPWENCLYSAEEERDFVRDHLGPALKNSGPGGLDVKLFVHDHNREDMLARARCIYADPLAAQYVYGVAFHWYGDPRYETWVDKAGMLCYDNVLRVHELRPEKHLIMTEATQEGGPHVGEWQVGERYAENIIKDLNNWTEAWIDWNLWLDKKGGPNHVSNFCSAPILVDPAKDLVIFQPSYFYIGHFSRYIQPGAQRILCSSSRDALETTAFANPDGTMVCVVLNQTSQPIDFWLEVGVGRATSTTAIAHSITTYIFRC